MLIPRTLKNRIKENDFNKTEHSENELEQLLASYLNSLDELIFAFARSRRVNKNDNLLENAIKLYNNRMESSSSLCNLYTTSSLLNESHFDNCYQYQAAIDSFFHNYAVDKDSTYLNITQNGETPLSTSTNKSMSDEDNNAAMNYLTFK